MARIKLLLTFFGLVILASGVAGAVFYWDKIAAPDFEMTQEIDGKSKSGKKREIPDLGKRHFDKAVDLLKEGNLEAAKETFYYLLEYYPESKTYPEARRILGEVNMDLLISKTPIPGKTEYVVRGGDAPASIARRTETTIDYLMRANGKTRTLIYKDERLSVFPLNFELEIKMADKKIIMTHDGTFFKEYDILGTNLNSAVKPPIKTEIKEKVAWDNGRRVQITSKDYLNCQKWIRTGKIGLFIRPVEFSKSVDGQAAPPGIFVSKPDIEELFTVVRGGSVVLMTE